MRSAARSIRSTLLILLLTAVVAPGCAGQEPGGLDEAGLRTMIDSLLPRIADASGLAVRQPVQFAVQAPDDVRAFIQAQIREELTPEEFDGMDRVYKMMGLLPDTLDLRALLLDLYTEQVVGYYDPKTDRLYVVEGVAEEEAGPVVAHELVHALQDQHVDLDSLVARERGNDRQIAAQAAAEGQATLVMMALQAAQTTGQAIDPGALPDLETLLRPTLESENARYPVFQNAPRLIRETLLFPYLAGAGFVQALYRARPNDEPPVPFGPLLPQSTEQVLDPVGRFVPHRDSPTEVSLDEARERWDVAYTNTLGQLELGILLAEHLGDGAQSDTQGWDGDRYALLRGPGGAEALVLYIVWDDAQSADRFAETYRRVMAARPGRVARVERRDVDGRPVVAVVEAAAGTALDVIPAPAVRSLVESADG